MSIFSKILRAFIILMLSSFLCFMVINTFVDLISAVFLSQEPSYEDGCELLFSEDCL